MKVSELIEILKDKPPELPVMKVSDLQKYLESFNPEDEIYLALRRRTGYIILNETGMADSILKFNLNSNKVYIVGDYKKDDPMYYNIPTDR